MCPVPEGNGIRVASRPWCFLAKWRGVEKCSGTKPIRRLEGLGGVVERLRVDILVYWWRGGMRRGLSIVGLPIGGIGDCGIQMKRI